MTQKHPKKPELIMIRLSVLKRIMMEARREGVTPEKMVKSLLKRALRERASGRRAEGEND